MIVIPIKKETKHFEKKIGKFIYRYGYQKIDDNYVSACVEENATKYSKEVIHKKVADYCKSVGIPDEFDPKDYGYDTV